MCRCVCGDHPAPARGPKVPLYQLTPAGEAWLREHPLPPAAPLDPKTPRVLIRNAKLEAKVRAWVRR